MVWYSTTSTRSSVVYEGGDFLSKLRYSRRQRYAVPYNGEEVYLHWANADPYYEEGFHGRPTWHGDNVE